jgi:hypothetical protein
MAREVQRSVLPIRDQPSFGLVTYDARDPDTKFPAVGPLRPPEGAPNFNGIRAYAKQNHIKIEGLPADLNAEIPQSRPCTSSTTSSRSSSPSCIRPIRDPAPRPDPDVRRL